MAGLRFHRDVLVLAAMIALAGATPAHAATTPWVTTQGNRFVRTGTGAPVVLRGVNVSAGSNVVLQDRVVQLGANLVRIHVSWADLEPTAPAPGDPGWNTALFAAIQKQVGWYAAHSIDVMIDLHQYDWSSYFGGRGNGIPAWFYTTVHPGEYPPTARGEVEAYTAFYADPAAIRLYGQLAQKLAAAFAGDANVVGYEVLNEPYARAAQSGAQAVIGFEARIRQAFAGVDPKRTVFVMTRTGGDLGLMDATFRAFGGLAHVALDYHAYFAGRPGTGMSFDGEAWAPSWNATHMQIVHAYRGTEAAQAAVLLTPIRKADDLRIPLMVGEWGDLRGTRAGAAYQAQMLAVFDRHGLSWARWAMSAKDVFGILDARSDPTAAFVQLQRALATPSPPPPPPGPHLPAFAVSRPALSLSDAGARPLLLCARPAARSTHTTISVRRAGGRLVRHIGLGSVAAGRVACRRWRGGNGAGGRVRPGTVFIRVSARYAAGRRFSVWRPVVVRP
ncbi:MAG TPA: cellulase family glycosylhydrolase [Gaiellales bacterium]